jgi:hypothetical protein
MAWEIKLDIGRKSDLNEINGSADGVKKVTSRSKLDAAVLASRVNASHAALPATEDRSSLGRASGAAQSRAELRGEREQTVRGNEINFEGNICKEATGCGKEKQRFSGREMRKILRKTVS